MAADSYGPRGAPQFAGSGASADAEDLTLLGARIAVVGNRMTGTAGQRQAIDLAARTPEEAWPGLEFDETDTGDVYKVTPGRQWKLTDRVIDAPLTLNAGWVAGNATSPIVAVRGRMASLPFVLNRLDNSGLTVCTLPGYARPITTVVFDCASGGGSVTRVVILPNGAVQVPAGGTFSGTYLSTCTWALGV